MKHGSKFQPKSLLSQKIDFEIAHLNFINNWIFKIWHVEQQALGLKISPNFSVRIWKTISIIAITRYYWRRVSRTKAQVKVNYERSIARSCKKEHCKCSTYTKKLKEGIPVVCASQIKMIMKISASRDRQSIIKKNCLSRCRIKKTCIDLPRHLLHAWQNIVHEFGDFVV